MRKKRFLNVVVCVFMLAFLLPNTAYAYLDAGTGSQILQMLMAFGMAIIVLITTSFAKIKIFLMALFRRKKSERAMEDVSDSEAN